MMKKLFIATCISLVASAVLANDYPNKPVRIIVPSNAGSGADSAARFFGEQLGRRLGQSFVVENKPGANGTIGAMFVKQQPADGYTVCLGSNSPLVVTPVITKDIKYDALKDFAPLSGTTRGMTMISVSAKSDIKSFKDLLAAAGKAQTPITVGTFTAGYQLSMEWLAQEANVKFLNVPYKGGVQMFTDLLGGQLDFAVSDIVGVTPFVTQGSVRPLAVTGEARHPQFPDVPTVREQGFPEFTNYVWSSFLVRAETPPAIQKKLADALAEIFKTEEAARYAKNNNTELLSYGPQEMREFKAAEYKRFENVAKRAGIQPQ